jgi:Fe-S oxidoreductase
MVTLEEEHSTRGRAHMLFEMLQGEVVDGGWRNEEVKKSLDLCLACKACKSECPANVDLATYKAEFLSHYYEGRLRPLHAYAFGMIDRWAKLAAFAPRIANELSSAPGIKQILGKVLGLAPQREIPQFAVSNFQKWAARQGIADCDGSRGSEGQNGNANQPEVILWADTFNNYFRPDTSRAAYDVLMNAGCKVRVPRKHFCCGRPLYDFGMLDQAKAYLRRILDVLGPEIDAGIPIVVLEPSCASVFRDELVNLFPGDTRAEKLRRQTFLLSEFLAKIPGYQPPRLSQKVLLHGHCHHKSIMKLNDEEALLRKMGVELKTLDSGCCGMAGPFGFEKEKYAVSQAVGERVLLPAVRAAEADTIVLTDGFSCREQIVQATGRRAVHLAEVLAMALKRNGNQG